MPVDKVPVVWNYRVVRHDHVSYDWFDLQEVHYDDEGEVFGYMPTGITANTHNALVEKLAAMLKAAADPRAVLMCNEGMPKLPKVLNDNVDGFTDEG